MSETTALQVRFPSDLVIVITRDFKAPRRLVFETWTRPEHLRHWMGPRRWEMTVCEVDLRVGGTYHYVLHNAEGGEMELGGEFLEIVPPERIVSTEWFTEWPGCKLQDTVVLEERDGVTTMTATTLFDSAEMRAAWDGFEAGAAESFDRLDEVLATLV